jgi:hypothetical protein
MSKQSVSQRIRRVAAIVAVLSMAPLTPASVPGVAPNSNNKIVSGPFGQTYSELSQEWQLWDIMQPLAQNPTFGAPCGNGQSGTLWFLYGGPSVVNCTIPAGTTLFVAIATTECSSLEPAPFHGDTPQQRAACAKAWIDNLTNLSASVDGVAITNFAQLRTRASDFSFTVPDGNILVGSGPAFGFSSADGYFMLLSPLSAGTHVITLTATFHDPFDPSHPVIFPLNTTIHLQVLP